MKFALILASFTLLTSSAFAETDLKIPGEKWLGKFTGYVCDAEGEKTAPPVAHSNLNVVFENVVTDATLDNGVIKATFTSNGNVCRYSAIMLADNTAQTITLVESKAYSNTEGVDCSEGKALLDSQFAPVSKYHYYGHPHHMAIMVDASDAADICGEGATQVGVDFIVSGRIK